MRETVIITGNFLLTPDFAIGIPYWESRGLILNNITSSTVSTVSFSNSSPFLSGLKNSKRETQWVICPPTQSGMGGKGS